MKKKVAAFQRHPWHGVPLGENAPDICTAYIEIVPGDTVKYEMAAIGEEFPHVYGLIPVPSVIRVSPLILGPDGEFSWPVKLG